MNVIINHTKALKPKWKIDRMNISVENMWVDVLKSNSSTSDWGRRGRIWWSEQFEDKTINQSNMSKLRTDILFVFLFINFLCSLFSGFLLLVENDTYLSHSYISFQFKRELMTQILHERKEPKILVLNSALQTTLRVPHVIAIIGNARNQLEESVIKEKTFREMSI